MSTRTMNPALSVVEQYGKLSQAEFDREIENTWEALDTIKDQIKQLVQQGQMTPLQGVGILACTTGQLFGYQAFHGHTTPVDAWQFSNGGSQQQVR